MEVNDIEILLIFVTIYLWYVQRLKFMRHLKSLVRKFETLPSLYHLILKYIYINVDNLDAYIQSSNNKCWAALLSCLNKLYFEQSNNENTH